MINIAIIDDDIKVCESLKNLVIKIYKKAVNVQTCASLKEFVFLQEDMRSNTFDVVLMDIVLDEGLGIDLAIDYEKINKKAKVIFITGYIDYAPDIFRAKPFGLLRKPIGEDKLKEAIDKAIEAISLEEQSYIQLRTRDTVRNVKLDDIVYVESEARKVCVHSDTDDFEMYMRLDDMENEINNSHFIRCHQSYLVNAKYICYMEGNKLVLENETLIPISRNRNEECKQKLMEYIQTKIG